MPLYSPAFTASADVNASRFVKISGEFSVAQCGDGQAVIGVSQEGTLFPPGVAEGLGGTTNTLAAKSGKTLKVFGLGDICVVLAGAAIEAGDTVGADADGKAKPLTASGSKVGGVALQKVASGEKCLIQVHPHTI